MEAVRVQYSRSFGGYLLQTSGLLRASRLKRTRQGEKNSLAGSKKSFPRLKKRPAGLKKRFPGLKKSFEVEKKFSRVEKKLFPYVCRYVLTLFGHWLVHASDVMVAMDENMYD